MPRRWPPVTVWVGAIVAAGWPAVVAVVFAAIAWPSVLFESPGGDPLHGVPLSALLVYGAVGIAWNACVLAVLRGSDRARWFVIVGCAVLLPCLGISLIALVALCSDSAIEYTTPRTWETGRQVVRF